MATSGPPRGNPCFVTEDQTNFLLFRLGLVIESWKLKLMEGG